MPDKKDKPIHPPFYFFVSLLVIVNLHYWFPFGQIIAEPYHYAGLLPAVIGAAIVLWKARIFAKAKTTIKPFEQPTHLFTEGLYQYSRNPMYLGMVLILVGAALFFGSLSAFFVVPAFVILIQQNFIVREEQMLSEAFGDEYAEYQKRVRRWL